MKLIVMAQLWWTEQWGRWRGRGERGNNSIEIAIIIGVVIVVATIIGIAIKAAVDARLPDLE